MEIPIAPTKGISARIPHTTEYCIFLDYDNILDPVLKQDSLPYLQELFKLGDFHVFGTSEYGRHAVCLDRMPLMEALEVVYNSDCDAVFKRGIRINEYRSWVLRVVEKGNRPKPSYLYSVESPHSGQRLQSQGHGMFFQTYYGAKVRLTNPDGNTLVEFQDYKTSSKIDMKDVEKGGRSK
jgi:hypothetical protein